MYVGSIVFCPTSIFVKNYFVIYVFWGLNYGFSCLTLIGFLLKCVALNGIFYIRNMQLT